MRKDTVISYAALAASVLLVLFGALFIVRPEFALTVTYHESEALPLVMGGRYAFFAALLAFVTLSARALLPMLLIGFAFLGVFDAIVYWAVQPWPHLIVGLVCLAAAGYLMAQKEEQA